MMPQSQITHWRDPGTCFCYQTFYDDLGDDLHFEEILEPVVDIVVAVSVQLAAFKSFLMNLKLVTKINLLW